MDPSSDLYRQMLAAASHTQQQRHAQLHHGDGSHTVCNVFLPALQHRTATHSALSMKHLQVIEQCILAENRREEQLAKCSNEKEKRYLAKKFQVQRAHERDLIHALMLGSPPADDLVIADTEAARTIYKSPLASTNVSPDKVFTMKGDRTFATTSPSKRGPTRARSPRLHEPSIHKSCGEGDPSLLLPQCSPSSTKKAAAKPRSPQRERPSYSASPVRKSEPKSPMKEMKLPHALAQSPLKPVARPAHAVGSKSSSPNKRKKVKPVSSVSKDKSAALSVDGTVVFDGATSFEDAQQRAMAIVMDRKELVGGDTQTIDRSSGAGDSNLHRSDKLMLKLATENRHHDAGGDVGKSPCRWPQSSPEPRLCRPSEETHVLPSLEHSPSESGLRHSVELLHKAVPVDPVKVDDGGRVDTYVSVADTSKTIQIIPVDTVFEALEARVVWNEPVPAHEAPLVEVQDDAVYTVPAATNEWVVHDEDPQAVVVEEEVANHEYSCADDTPDTSDQGGVIGEAVIPPDLEDAPQQAQETTAEGRGRGRAQSIR